MCGAVGPVGKELQGFRVLQQPIEVERCNTFPSGGWLVAHFALQVVVCPVQVAVSLRTYSSLPSALSGLTRQNPRITPLLYTLGPCTLATLVRIRGPFSSSRSLSNASSGAYSVNMHVHARPHVRSDGLQAANRCIAGHFAVLIILIPFSSKRT